MFQFSSIKNFISSNYLVELLMIAVLLYLVGAFIHFTFNAALWDVLTRSVIAVIYFCFVLFTIYVKEMKGVR